MARNERFHDGEHISLPVPTGTLSGAPVKSGPFVGVTQTAEGQGGNIAGRATVWRFGEYDLPTADAVPAEGTAMYITAANVLTVTAAGNTLFGWTHADALGLGATKSAGAGTVHVILTRV
jgi:predicted RecA/RadA family phage recombinase